MTRFVQQTNWARGEIESILEGRQDAEFYESAAELLDNWLPDTVASIRVRASFESIFKLPQTILDNDEETSLVLRRNHQNLMGYVYRGVQVLIHLAVYADAAGLNRLSARAYKVDLTKLTTDSPAQIVSRVAPGNRFVSEPFEDLPSKLVYEVGFAIAGPAAFITHRQLPVLRVFPTTPNPIDGVFNISEVEWFQELFGFATPESGTVNWEGDGDALFAEQLVVGDTIRFRHKLYTIATLEIGTGDEETGEPPGIHKFTTAEVYDGVSVADRVDVADADPFDGENPSLVAFYQGRLVIASTSAKPTGVWLSRSNDPFTIVPSSVDENSPINQELFAEGADEFVWMTGGDRLYLGSGLGEYALGSSEETISPLQLRFFRIGNNGGAKITPVIVDGLVLFTNRSRSQVLGVVFDLGRQAFSTTNMSQLSGHLTRDVLDLAFRPPVANDRTPRIFALTAAGLRAFAMSQEAGLAAWARVSHTPAFKVVAITGTSEFLFAITNRTSGSVDMAVLRNE